MKHIIAIGLGALCLQVSAQNHADILRFSSRGMVGSARTMGLSGAFGAGGADLSAASINPAGLGLYRSNQFLLSSAITSTLAEANYTGNLQSDSRTNFNVPNIGIALNNTSNYMGKPRTKGIVSGTLVFGLNRLNDYSANIQYNGVVKNTTVGDYLAERANGINFNVLNQSSFDNYLAAQAWRVALIDSVTGTNNYVSIQDLLRDSAYAVGQFQQIKNQGRMQEWYFGGGVNVSNFLYLGATMVIQQASYETDLIYRETLKESSVKNNPYSAVSISQSLETTGSGVGGKFGFILRPAKFIRIGGAYHTPVRLSMTDNYQNSLTMRYSNGGVFTAPEQLRQDYYEYQIVTPGRLLANAAIIVGKSFLFTADYERIDYRKGRLQATNDLADFVEGNANNKLLHDVAEIYRAGVEFNYDFLRLRAGYAYIGSPYDDDYIAKNNGKKQLISGGLGWVYDNTIFFDFAVSSLIGTQYHVPFRGNPETATISVNRLNFMLGAGFKF